MILFVDDVRPAPNKAIHCLSVNQAKAVLTERSDITVIDLDHDAGDYASDGGDFIKLLDWLEETGQGDKYSYRLHTMNPIGRENMRRIINRNHWKELK